MTEEIQRIREQLEAQRYVTDEAMATSLFLAMKLGKPLLIEGHAGVGKTEVAKALAAALGTNLIRLQCYEGLDANSALYEWDYARQMLHIKLTENSDRPVEEREQEIFGERFLLKRPLLQAILQEDRAPVLLIDEVDRADEEFEAFLLEVLSDFQVTVPELGTLRARQRPHVVLTSNRVRELSDALQRRCIYLWIDYPTVDRELEIMRVRLPGVDSRLAQQVVRFVQALRRLQLDKRPGIAETLDWASALMALDVRELDPADLDGTWGCILKGREDIARAKGELNRMLAAARKEG